MTTMNERDYYAQFVGDEDLPVVTPTVTWEWSALEKDLFDQIASRHRVPLDVICPPPALSPLALCVMGAHDWGVVIGGRRCRVCGKQEAVPTCEEGSHIWGASVMESIDGTAHCVICGKVRD